MLTQLIEPDLEVKATQLIEETQALAGGMKIVKITSSLGYQAAGEARIRINRQLKDLEALRLELTRPLDAIKKKWMDFFRTGTDALEGAKRNVDAAILDYEREQRARQEAAERLAREEAKKKEDAQKKKLEEQAAKAAAKGQAEKAEELREQAEMVYIPPAEVAPTLPKVAGLQTRDNWTFEVLNENLIPREYMIPDLKMIGATARNTKGKLEIPGIRIFNQPVKAS